MDCYHTTYPPDPNAPGAATFPRAGIDPITDPVTAFGIMMAVIGAPDQFDTICLLLHHDDTGAGVAIVHRTADPDDVVEVIEQLVDEGRHDGRLGAIVVASVRPCATELQRDDSTRWLQLDMRCTSAGVRLIEWWVVGAVVLSPRVAAGGSSRWACDL